MSYKIETCAKFNSYSIPKGDIDWICECESDEKLQGLGERASSRWEASEEDGQGRWREEETHGGSGEKRERARGEC